ncbi:methyltransferase [Pseudaminobacter sp. 19-2017]|uniref:Methyltransferase n=1 Tax=Pseudaminobacter soli (ex Zhang et al. 2022) TaxID=2831468 RepID=A0A942E0D9_9HYPH|nr:methyltransferase [Pseudaminobacter soli]MBS3648300.1 methyltransferase [Pseudaminobacter soli]
MLTSSDPSDEPLTDRTVDGFHRGRFFLVQPAKGGHRAGMDALVLAAATPSGFAGMAVDFGAGAGAVGFAVAARCPAARVLLVERSPEMVSFARLSLANAGNSHLASRIDILQTDVSLAGRAREAAGLRDRSADFVLMNPPFNEPIDRSTPNELRREAHVGSGSVFADWLRSAAAVLKPRGKVALIARPSSLADILTALSGRFGGAEILPVYATLSRPAIRIVVRAIRGARGAPSIMPPLVLHREEDQSFTAEADAILSGESSLFDD